MVRRHPTLSVVASVYFVGLALLFLTPNTLVSRGTGSLQRSMPWASASAVDVAVGVVLFVPMGVLLVLITGRRRWVAVLVVGVVACCWLRLAEMVWVPDGEGVADSVVPHIAGTAAGVAGALAVLAMRRRPRESVAAVVQRP